MGEYSVAINNRFALAVDEEEDLYELLEKQQEEKKLKEQLAAEQAAKAKLTKGKPAKSAKSNTKRILKTNDTNTNTQTNSRTAYPRNDENRPPRFARQQRDGPSDNSNFEKPPSEIDGERRGGRGGMRGRGGPRGGYNARPRRDFDRHSGSDKTGVKAVEKREGFGPHNWGDEIQAQLDQPADQQTEATTELAEDTAADAVEAEPVEEEPVEMTLEEWKAQQAGTKKAQEFKVRKANEGSDSKQWKGTVALEKKKKGDHSDEEEEEYEYEEEVNMTKATLEKLNIQITFAESGRGGGGGGGMRGGRGGRGRGFNGPPRGPRSGGRGRGGYDRRGGDRNAVPRVDNEADFPSLGGR